MIPLPLLAIHISLLTSAVEFARVVYTCCFQLPSVSAYSGCHNKMPLIGDPSHRNVFSHSSRGFSEKTFLDFQKILLTVSSEYFQYPTTCGSPRSRFGPIHFLPRAHLLAYRQLRHTVLPGLSSEHAPGVSQSKSFGVSFFCFLNGDSLCHQGWSAVVRSQLTATSTTQVQAILPASASQVAGITGACYHIQLIFVFFS